jgi:hypothetical protein
MRGSDDDPGMMILCIRDIFDYIETHPNLKFTLKVSYMEVYNEEINDLLGDGPVSSLSLSLSLSLFVSDSLSLSRSSSGNRSQRIFRSSPMILFEEQSFANLQKKL